mgnify:CR=1 FL=1
MISLSGVDFNADWNRTRTAGEAKKDFFLDASDLAHIPYQPASWGASKYYKGNDLFQAAVAKYGSDGFVDKLEKREQRVANKRKREEEANANLVSMGLATGANNGNGRSVQPRIAQGDTDFIDLTGETAPAAPAPAARVAAPAPAPVVVDPALLKSIESIRKSILSQAKKQMGARENGGCKLRVELPGMSKQIFAYLIGRPQDPELRTLVKTGAFYSHDISAEALFAKNGRAGGPLIGTLTHTRYNTPFVMDGDCTLKYKPSSMMISFHAYDEVDHDNC